MRSYIYILLILFICSSCKSQEKNIEYDYNNLIIFKDIDPTIKVIGDYRTKYLFTFKYLFFIKASKYVDVPRPMKLLFVKNKDTMNLTFAYGCEQNVCVKNFKFKKGSYSVVAVVNSNSKKYLLKKEELPEQNIISKNQYIEEEKSRRDVELKDMIFYEADLNDTKNVKIKEIKK